MAPHRSSPTAVANDGSWMVSIRPLIPVGPLTRTGICSTSRPSSAVRASGDAPPVRMIPAGSIPWPLRDISVRSSSNVSRMRLSMIWHSSSRLTVRPASSPSTATEISSSSRSRRSHVPCRTLSCSATWSVVLTPIATSLVTLLPPTGSTAVWNGEPSENSVRSMVTAPMSATATPSSFSVSVSTASDEASPSTTSSSIFTPASWTHLVRFWTAVADALTMCASTSSRSALIPSGSLTPSWPSTVNPRRSTWSTSRLLGIDTARATSIARLMSSRVTSRWCAVTATWPVEFRLSTCWPPTPTKARSIFQPDSRSARSTASVMERTVWSMLTTTPLRSPLVSTVPWPITVRRPSRLTSPIRAQTLDVPTSMPTRTASRSTCGVSLLIRRCGTLDEVPPDQRDVVEDPEPEADEGDEVEVEAQPVAHEGEQHGDERVDDEAADEDPIVVDAVELGADRPKNGVERRQDGDGGVALELEPDVDVEEEPGHDSDEKTHQGQEHGRAASVESIVADTLPDPLTAPGCGSGAASSSAPASGAGRRCRCGRRRG